MVFGCFLLLGFSACGGDEEMKTPPLDKATMTNVLVDIHLLEARTDELNARPDSIAFLLEEEYEKLYREHGVSQADFKKTFSYYEKNPEQMDELYQGVIDQLVQLEVKLKAKPAADSTKQ